MFLIFGLFFSWIAVTGAAGILQGAEAQKSASDFTYRVNRWTAENGLPQNSVKALAQTPDGYLWIGTLNGLARFDGIRFKIYDQGNTPEMTHDTVNALAVDAEDGSLWVGTGRDLLRYKN